MRPACLTARVETYGGHVNRGGAPPCPSLFNVVVGFGRWSTYRPYFGLRLTLPVANFDLNSCLENGQVDHKYKAGKLLLILPLVQQITYLYAKILRDKSTFESY